MNKTQDAGLIREKTRLTKALADAREMKNRIMQGEYVKASDVQKAYAKVVTNIRQKLLALPAKLAPQLHNCSSPTVNAILTESIYEVLKELADEKIIE